MLQQPMQRREECFCHILHSTRIASPRSPCRKRHGAWTTITAYCLPATHQGRLGDTKVSDVAPLQDLHGREVGSPTAERQLQQTAHLLLLWGPCEVVQGLIEEGGDGGVTLAAQWKQTEEGMIHHVSDIMWVKCIKQDRRKNITLDQYAITASRPMFMSHELITAIVIIGHFCTAPVVLIAPVTCPRAAACAAYAAVPLMP